MTDEIARLVVAVDSTSAGAATKKLDDLAGAGDKATAATKALGAAQGPAKTALDQTTKSMGANVKTAGELRFATRGLPAQFTDIAVSLQAGQNPLTVFLQQGGQLKDMFGGIGPAAKALGGYVLGLINPISIAAATMLTLVVAAHQGEGETTKFNKTIAMTGGIAGATTDKLTQMSEAMDRGVTTQAQAANALNQVAASGKFVSAQFELISQAAIDMERATGQSVEDTVKVFAKLAEDPVAASAKLNESFHYLTAATFEQIKAAYENGDAQLSSQLATEAYADAVIKRSADVLASLGTLEQGWSYLKIGASAAWDAMLGIGRDTSNLSKIDEIQKKITLLETSSLAFAQYGGVGSEARQKRIAELRKDIQELGQVTIDEQKAAGQKANAAAAEQAGIRIRMETTQYKNNAEKRKAEITRTEKEAADAAFFARQAGDEKLAKQIEADQKIREAGIRDRYKDPKVKRSDSDREAAKALREQQAEYDRLNKSIDDHTATLNADLASTEKLTSAQKFIAVTLAQLDGAESKLDNTQKSKIKTDLEALRTLDQLNEIQKERNNLLSVGAAIQERSTNEAARAASDQARQLRAMGHSGEVNDLYSRMDRISDNAAEDRLELARRTGALRKENTAEYLRQLGLIDQAEREALAREKVYFAERKAAQADWKNGATRALEEISEESFDVAGQTYDAFKGAYSQMNSVIDEFTRTGKFKMKDFARYVIAELVKIELRIALSKVLGMFLGGNTGTVSPSSQGGGGGLGTGPASKGVAAGPDGLYPLSKGDVVTGARLYPLANGGRVLGGEAGAEGILPLQRGADGKLGVQSHGGSGGDVNVSITTIIQQDGSASSKTTGDDNAMAQQLGGLVEGKIREVLVQERKQGGILWAMSNGR